VFRRVDDASACPFCGRWVSNGSVCGACTDSPPLFERGLYGFYFEGPLREALLAFKFEGRKDVGRHLIRLLGEKVVSMREEFDVIVPLPVTEKRLKERGFNQCYIMAEEISAIAKKPLSFSALGKKKETKDQYTLSREDRRKNVRGAFAVHDKGELRGKRILLVDDLMTTGHTAREASRILLSARAQSVLFFALARTP
jgi:competence protein ComFC